MSNTSCIARLACALTVDPVAIVTVTLLTFPKCVIGIGHSHAGVSIIRHRPTRPGAIERLTHSVMHNVEQCNPMHQTPIRSYATTHVPEWMLAENAHTSLIKIVVSTTFLYTLKAQYQNCPHLPPNAIRVAAAAADPCAWQCQTGNFRTSPPTIVDSTCRSCSKYVCSKGQVLLPCNGNSDTMCVRCPQFRNIIYTSNASCVFTQCAPGYQDTANSSQTHNTTCHICDRGFYCVNGVRNQCGVDETTYASGADVPLYCQPVSSSSVSNNIAITISYITTTKLSTTKPAPDIQTLLSWVQYGSISTCKLSTTDGGMVQCLVTIGTSVSGLYVLWLQSTLNANVNQIQSLLSATLLQPTLNVVSIHVTPNTATPLPSITANTSKMALSDVPLLQLSPMRWGSSQDDVQITLLFVTALLSLLFVACAALVAIAVVQFKFRTGIRRALAQISADHHYASRSGI
jgi:hypothetical protein